MRCLFITIAAALLAALPCWALDPPRKVIWVAVDSLRAQNLSYMGYERDTAPWLKELAQKSVNFTLGISPSNVTRRSVAATFAGKYYFELHAEDQTVNLPLEVHTLPEVLQAAGFSTGLWTANWHLDADVGFTQGFDQSERLVPKSSVYASIDEIIRQVRAKYRSSGGLEFHYIHTMDVHEPYRAPIPFDALFAPDYSKSVVWLGSMKDFNGELVVANTPYYSETHDVQQADIDFLISQYDGAIRYTDEKLPQLLDAFAFDWDRDMLIVSADHGEQFFEQGFWMHGMAPIPQETHVPLLVYAPGLTPRTVDHPVSLIDLFPTLCELFALDAPEGLSGSSLLPACIEGTAPANPFIFTEIPDPLGPAAAVIGDGFWYWVHADIHKMHPDAVWPFYEALYELESDPLGMTNVVASRLEIADRMNAKLLEISPRWFEYAPKLIRGGADQVEYGPNLFSPKADLTNAPWLATVQESGREAFELNAPPVEVAMTAHIEDPGLAHRIEIEYRPVWGPVAFELRSADGKELYWHYESFKPSDAPKKVAAMVRPVSSDVRLTVRPKNAGQVRVVTVSLRRAVIPTPEHGFDRLIDEFIDENALTDDDKQRLKDMGYL